MPKVDLYNLGSLGVDLTKSAVHANDGSLLSAQNAIPDYRGEAGGHTKRDGLTAINSTTVGGSVLGAINIPLPATARLYIGRDDGSTELAIDWLYTTDLSGATTPWTSVTSIPAQPRSTDKLGAIDSATPPSAMGRPTCTMNNRIYYAAANYTIGTDDPPIRVFDGVNDRELCRIPRTSDSGTRNRGIITMIANRGKLYASAWDGDTKSSVYSIDPTTGAITKMGATFDVEDYPHAMTAYLDRLWVGTVSGDPHSGTDVGKVYWMRFSGDTAFTLDHTTTSGQGSILDLKSYKGLLYAAVIGSSGKAGLVKVRALAGTWSTSDTGAATGVNQGYTSLEVFENNLYATYRDTDSGDQTIRKFDGSSWATPYSETSYGANGQLVLWAFGDYIYAVGPASTANLDFTLLVSSDGTTWTNRSVQFANEASPTYPHTTSIG